MTTTAQGDELDGAGQGQPYRENGKSLLGLLLSPLVWQRLETGYAVMWMRYPGGLRVLESLERHNGEQWLHVSCSYPTHLPDWDDLRLVKEAFCGKDREAYIVLPPQARYVNDDAWTLHLWCPMEGAVLPDFRRFGPRPGKGEGWTL